MNVKPVILTTKRLILRPWKQEDFEPFARMNADPRVMEYFPAPLTVEESRQMVKRIESKITDNGWGFWATCLRESEAFIGFIGLNSIIADTLPAYFVPAFEIGWRLSFDHWGKGYATEGARAALNYAFMKMDLKEVVSFTAKQNQRSRKVMERLGMQHDPVDEFDHPSLPLNSPLKRHVLYRLKNSNA